MREHARISVRVLLVTGDLVEQPDDAAVNEALDVVDRPRTMPEFMSVLLVAGNHDVRAPSVLEVEVLETSALSNSRTAMRFGLSGLRDATAPPAHGCSPP
jgi:metallophosphoesterase superfamily enzyme